MLTSLCSGNQISLPKKDSMKIGINWSELPPELLETVARKLTIYIDYVRFRAVCVKWCSSVSSKPHHHLPTQLPWLLFPYFTSDIGTTHHRSFLDLSTNKFHHLSPMESRDSRCCGSSQGWLAFVEKSTPEIRLINPVTGNVIHLPSLTTIPNVLAFQISSLGCEYLIKPSLIGCPYTRSLTKMRDYFIKKVVLSTSPNSLENDYIALLIFNEIPGLAFHKKGGVEEWSFIKEAGYYYYEDAIYYNGSFYAINEEGIVSIFDLSGVTPIMTLIPITAPPKPKFGHVISYLVDSFGELMLVTRYMKLVRKQFELDHDYEYDAVYVTVRFGVFKYDSSKPEWVQMNTLGDHMLFLGGNSSSVCLSASDFSGCERNCIYFSSQDKHVDIGHFDFGVYRLDDRSIVPLPYGRSSSQDILPPPIWVTPNPC